MRHFLTHVAWAALLLTACHTHHDSGLTWKRAIADRQQALSSEHESPQCNVHIDICYADTANNREAATEINTAIAWQLLDIEGADLQQAADSFANRYADDYRRNLLALYREDQSDTEKRPWYEYRYVIDTSTEAGRDGVEVYRANVDYYEGGAHGINQLLTMNFDTQTGRLLQLRDVFVPGYEQQLNELLLDELLRQTDSKDKDELKKKGYLYSMNMFAPENFILGADAVTFVYNTYEIAPYSVGRTELTLDYDKLEKILKQQ